MPEPPRWLVLHAEAIDDVDFTGGQTLAELADQLAERGIVFAIANADAHLLRELERFGVTAKIGREHVFDTLHEARDAFRRSAAAGAARPPQPPRPSR